MKLYFGKAKDVFLKVKLLADKAGQMTTGEYLRLAQQIRREG